MIIDIPLETLERAITAFGCVRDEACSDEEEDQAKVDAALLRKKIDDAAHAAHFQALLDCGDDE